MAACKQRSSYLSRSQLRAAPYLDLTQFSVQPAKLKSNTCIFAHWCYFCLPELSVPCPCCAVITWVCRSLISLVLSCKSRRWPPVFFIVLSSLVPNMTVAFIPVSSRRLTVERCRFLCFGRGDETSKCWIWRISFIFPSFSVSLLTLSLSFVFNCVLLICFAFIFFSFYHCLWLLSFTPYCLLLNFCSNCNLIFLFSTSSFSSTFLSVFLLLYFFFSSTLIYPLIHSSMLGRR